ncbi:MAG: tRNA 2-thiocytidine(32) synthetase TtcA [Clostridia bacterium]|nr:tRNA 2-thiocytidine(32) synthetase TtcA [Clostridia bacterium]MBR4053769.1 tRNA 2-thiocytidine(32) synthetase TtcA [Clostridia bacterium]
MINTNVPQLQRLLSSTRRAVDDYGMINEGDRIAVGISGGKDSMALLAALAGLQRFYPKKFEIVPIHLKMGFPGSDDSNIRELCEALHLPLVAVKTDIYEVVFEVRKEKSPCSLCANLRRGILYSTAKEHGCYKIALGHHFDDAVETLLMNLFIEGNLGCFSPVTYLDRMDVTMIRPLLYAKEKELRSFVTAAGITCSPKYCPADGNTKREEWKQFLAEMERKDPGVKDRLFGAIERANLDGFSVHKRGRKE